MDKQLSADDAMTLMQFIEEHWAQFQAWCKANSIYEEAEIESEAETLIARLKQFAS